MSIVGLIASNNFIAVNKTLIREFGLECAVMLGELASQHEYFKDNLQDGFFYATVDRIKDDTGLSDYQQRQAVTKLQTAGILETKVMGIPAKRFFRISEEALQNKFSKNYRTGSEKTAEQAAEKLQRNKNIITRTDIRTDNVGERTPAREYPESIDEILKIAAGPTCAVRMTRQQAENYFLNRMAADWFDASGRKIQPSRVCYDIRKWVLRDQQQSGGGAPDRRTRATFAGDDERGREATNGF